jgi:glutamate-1-semialdehyde 2,1-aminomutase
MVMKINADKRYAKSEAYLDRATRVIPLGSQTFSKSITQYPVGVSPLALARGKGSRVWDLDGHEYLDFVNALLAISLGYTDPDVDKAVAEQLALGTIFSLPHPLEAEVAELICACVPSAEMVRFGKNGSDATAGAVRLARAHTGRDHVLVCGYHGWQDWFIGSTPRNRGVPEATRALTHAFPYNDLAALTELMDKYHGKVACVILEPMNIAWPQPGYLEGVRELCSKAGALLVFDETITGFRFAKGGAQQLFGIKPDLTTLGKGLANGFPLSVVCGRRDIMMLMEEIFFSFTLGGEALSLAAAKATISKINREPVIETMTKRGERLVAGLSALIEAEGLGGLLSVSGHPTWSFLNIADAPASTSWATKTLFLQEMFARGILVLSTHNISYAHSEADIDQLLGVYGEVLPFVHRAAVDGCVEQHLKVRPLQPLFSVRGDTK